MVDDMKESSLQAIGTALDEYNNRYNTKFKLSDRYSLFPKEEGEYGYNDEWPGNKHAGVYLVMTKDYEILYVGQSKDIGQRLYEHFPPCNGSCNIKEIWQKPPYYLYIITVPDNAIWERLSLEEFLIQKFEPIDNKRGKEY